MKFCQWNAHSFSLVDEICGVDPVVMICEGCIAQEFHNFIVGFVNVREELRGSVGLSWLVWRKGFAHRLRQLSYGR